MNVKAEWTNADALSTNHTSCSDNRVELIDKYKNELIESTNIKSSQDEMDVIDSILFRFWQMGWLEKLEHADRRGGLLRVPLMPLGDRSDRLFLCSRCGTGYWENDMNYCPNCGVRLDMGVQTAKWLKKEYKRIGYEGCKNCVHDPNECEWLKRSGDGNVHFVCPDWEKDE